MPEPSIVALIGLGAAFTGWVGYTVRSMILRRRAERRIDAGLGAFREGEEATVVGKVRAIGTPLVAPLSGTECVAYDARARCGLLNFSTQPERVEVRVVPFEIETSAGRVRVEADRAELVFPRVPLIPRRVEREAEFIRRHGLDAPLADVDCSEICVEVGREVAVHGVVSMTGARPQAEGGYRDGTVQLELGPHPEHQLTIGEPR